MDATSNVGIFIPTKDRSEFLIRQLRYYAAVKSPHPIYIGDSSGEKHAQRIREEVAQLQGRITVVYNYYPLSVYSHMQCTKDLVWRIQEPYCVFSGDDDFHIPSDLSRCAAFLSQNPEYASAHGQGLLVELVNHGPYGVIRSIHPYPRDPIEGVAAADRLSQLLQNSRSYFVLLFSVHRTPQMRRQWDMVDELDESTFSGELFPSCLSVIAGKTKVFPGLGVVRQRHDARNVLPDIFDRITNPQWSSAYQVFHDRLVEELMKKDHITATEAHAVVKRVIWHYLDYTLNLIFQLHYHIPQSFNKDMRLKDMLKRVPGIVFFRSLFQSLRAKHLALSSLLNPRSPLHDDFLPIYHAISNIKK